MDDAATKGPAFLNPSRDVRPAPPLSHDPGEELRSIPTESPEEVTFGLGQPWPLPRWPTEDLRRGAIHFWESGDGNRANCTQGSWARPPTAPGCLPPWAPSLAIQKVQSQACRSQAELSHTPCADVPALSL